MERSVMVKSLTVLANSFDMNHLYKERSWSDRRDLNPRPSAWEADALPLSYCRNLTHVQRGEIVAIRVTSLNTTSRRKQWH